MLKAYYAFVHSHIAYTCFIWGGATGNCKGKILVLQKAALRIFEKKGSRDTCKGTVSKLKILTVPSINVDNCIQIVTNNYDELKMLHARLAAKGVMTIPLPKVKGKFNHMTPTIAELNSLTGSPLLKKVR